VIQPCLICRAVAQGVLHRGTASVASGAGAGFALVRAYRRGIVSIVAELCEDHKLVFQRANEAQDRREKAARIS
jgi:hypothetical protein